MRKRAVAILITALVWTMAVGTTAFAEDPPTKETILPQPAPAPGDGVNVTGVALSVNGTSVDAAPPGVEVNLILTLRNGKNEALTNVRAKFVEPPDGVKLTDAEATYGTIPAGKDAVGVFAFEVDPAKCTDFLGLGGEITYDGGSSPLKIPVPVACPGPRLGISDAIFEGGDGDGVPEPGETLRMFIVLGNEGNDPATKVSGKFTFGDDVTAANDSATWPDIAAHSNAKSLSPIVITIPKDAKLQDGCGGTFFGKPEPVTDGTVPPDSVVSSDGNTSSVNTQPPSGSGTGAPGSAGGSEPGSSGTGGVPTQVDPAPPSTGQAEPPEPTDPAPSSGPKDLPLPSDAGSTEPGGGTIEPGGTPEPAPLPGQPGPTPEPQDAPALVTATIAVTASDYKIDVEYSNQVFCALEGGAVRDDKAFAAPQATAAHGKARGGTAFPIVIAVLASIAAVGTRKLVTR